MILAAALAFAPAILGSAHLDDYAVFADPAYTTPAGAWELLSPARVRPLTSLTLWANYQLHGDSPWGYHLVNLLLHLAAIWLASDALRRLLPAPAAWLALVVFALHPLQTEPVAYIYARSTLLCGLFSWAAIAAWMRERPWLAVAATALALLSKEEAVALPLFFLLWHREPSKALAAMLLLAVTTGLRGLWATAQIQGSGAGLDVAMPPLSYALSQGAVIVRYLRLLLVPIGLNFDPDLHPEAWLSAVAWGGLATVVFFLKGERRVWFLAGLVFLAPTSSFLPIDDLAADRRMYLAAPFFAIALAPSLKRNQVAVLAILLGALSFARTLVFRTEESLWRDTVAASPGKIRPLVQLARAVPTPEALALLQNLPGDRAAAERGRVYLELGRPADALREFGAVLASEPGDPRALVNRGTALAALGQRNAARQDFLRALARDPCFYPALLNLRQLGYPLPVLGACRFPAQQKERLASP
ncbi:MAG: glycosyltransferase family 39 protein [Bryobacteraceae bacterium]|nr:glycosyltransferase family 39 protein [Bryobacteraceae bacterium]